MKVTMSSQNWGACNDHCLVENPLDNLLQEAKLRIISVEQCQKLTKGLDLEVSQKNEICAGKPVFRKKLVYRAKLKRGVCMHLSDFRRINMCSFYS